MDRIHSKLIKYSENNIIPKYLKLDLAHQPDHVESVIKKSLDIAKDYNVDLNMVYVIAVFHDLGLLIDRKTHHLEGAKLLGEDTFIRQMFNDEDILIMKEAIEDHRASNQFEPRSIYGKIISEADRLIDPETVILRCIKFQLSKSSNPSFNHIYPPVKAHLIDKYGSNGYLKIWLKTKENETQLKALRRIIEDESKLLKITKQLYDKLI